jgi:hypothetical protein
MANSRIVYHIIPRLQSTTRRCRRVAMGSIEETRVHSTGVVLASYFIGDVWESLPHGACVTLTGHRLGVWGVSVTPWCCCVTHLREDEAGGVRGVGT